MSFKAQTGFIAAAACALTTLAGGSASAGLSSPSTATCTFYSDGSGYCSGTLKAFRNSSDSTALLTLQSYAYSGGTSRYVYLVWQGQTKYVYLNTSSSAVLAAFDNAVAAVDAQVYVHWNTSTNIDAIQLWNASYQL